MTRGRFISLEGIEGVGKSTQTEFIKQVLQTSGVENIVVTREPGGTPIAESIRHVLLSHHDEPMMLDTELLLLFAGRAQHIQNLILPALDRGDWVLCDRFVDASYAYQGAGRGVPNDLIEILDKWICKNCQPDLTLLFDAPVQQALSRITHRVADRIESETEMFFWRVRDAYMARATYYPKRFRVVDASVSPEAVQTQLQKILSDFLKGCA